MKKAIFLLGMLALPLLTFNSCEKEDDSTEPISYENTNLKHIVSATRYGGPYTFKYDSEGRMIYEKWGLDSNTAMELNLQYTNNTISGTRSFDSTQDSAANTDEVVSGTLNSNGYVSSIKFEDETFGTGTTYNYTYDANNHRVSCRTSSDGSVTNWVWRNGNLASIKEEGQNSSVTFTYTNETITEPIENKGKLLLLTVDNEVDEMVNPIYGVASKELPVSATTTFDGQTVTATYKWTLDEDGYPVKLLFSTSYGANVTYTFVWQ